MWWSKKSQRKSKKSKTKSDFWYQCYKEYARAVITKRVDFFARQYNFTYNRIAIRNQKRCWGSCSSKQNLNFNYKLIFLETKILDYVVVHELCHLKHFNHSQTFWQEIQKILPEYKTCIKQLRNTENIVNLQS